MPPGRWWSIGDVDAWAANWALAAVVREEAEIVVHGGQREYRVFARPSTLPPLLDDPMEQCWVIRADGERGASDVAAPRGQLKPLSAPGSGTESAPDVPRN